MDVDNASQYRPYIAVILIMCRLASSTYFMSPVFMLFTPDHWCKPVTNFTLQGAQSSNHFIATGKYHSDDNMKCHEWKNSTAYNSTLESCTDGWVYNLHLGATTAVTEFSMVCDKAWIKPVLTSLMMAGFMIGGLLSGTVSDGFGRKRSLLVAMVGELGCVLAVALSPSVPLLGTALFASGLFFATLTMTSPVLLMELSPESVRSTLVLIQVAAFSIGYAVLCPIAYLLPNWRHMMFGIAGFLFCCYVPVIIIPESNMWRRRNDTKRPEERKSKADENSREDEDQTLDSELSASNNNINNNPHKVIFAKTNTYLDFLTVKFLFRRASILILAWTSCSFSLFGFNFNTGQMEGNRYLNSFLSTLVDLPGIFMLHLLARKVGYIRGFAIQSALGGLILLIMPFLIDHPAWTSTLCALLGKSQLGAGFAALYAYTGTIFPTALRNQAYGICSSVSRISVVLMPFVLYAGEIVHESLPYLIMSMLMLTSSFAVLFLPITKDQPLPHTLSDAKYQHRLQWNIRCAPKHKSKKEKNQGYELKPNSLLIVNNERSSLS
uniref:Solute carrier family 22-like n=1 Tax=Phallusia mammillata TaxID=59560 RepID=A0A6F9DT50_9ASCI|nr:solute carrier family 22-like [Phallusia mammillata]